MLTLVRTALLNHQGRLQGYLFKTAFLRQISPFMRLLAQNVLVSFAASSVESTSKYVLERLSIQWQEWLVGRIHRRYFENMVRSLQQILANTACTSGARADATRAPARLPLPP